MSLQALTEKIISDAEAEAEAIISSAKEKAAEVIANAEAEAEKNRAFEEKEVEERIRAIRDGAAATARLEGKKIVLAERRRVIDVIYERALESLISLPEKESLALLSELIGKYAEEGDEVVLSKDYPYFAGVSEIVQKKKLKLSKERAAIRGGFVLRGVKCDRNVSFEALLQEDREKHQAELAKKLFKTV